MKTPQAPTLLSSLALAASMTAIAIQFPPLSGYVAGLQGAGQASDAQASAPNGGALTATQAVGSDEAKSDRASSDDVLAQGERIARLEQQLRQFERVIRSSGLDAAAPFLAPPPGADAPLLAHIGEQYATRAQFEQRRETMLERAKEMRQRDMDAYGASSYQAIADLYAKARPVRGNVSAEEKAERQAALDSLMTSYPEAWSTSVAVAEQALDAAINRDTQGVESYYQSLLETSPYSEVVTEQGIDAIPTLQTYLARQYVEEGRYDDAAAVLDSLTAQGDSIILEPNEMGEPTARSAQDIATELRDKMSQQ